MTVLADLRETRFDPLLTGKALFMSLVEAAARPGQVVGLGDIALDVPSPRLRCACAILLAVMDREVGFHVLGPGSGRLREYLRFNTGAHVVDLGAADFVLVTESGPSWEAAVRGPVPGLEPAATVVLAPTSLQGQPGPADVTLMLSGPGIDGTTRLSLHGLTVADVALLLARGEGPRAVDVWLAAADGHLAVIPRAARCRLGPASTDPW